MRLAVGWRWLPRARRLWAGYNGAMIHAVREGETPGQPPAVIAEATTWSAFPSLWPRLLDTVWTAVRSSEEITPNRNVMLYLDDVPNVEVGVEVGEPISHLGRVVGS